MLEIKGVTDKKNWQSFLDNSHIGSYPFFQTWDWGEVLKELDIPIYRLGLFDNNELVGVLLIAEIKAKRGHYLYLRHGPVFRSSKPLYFDCFLDYVKSLAKKNKASFIRISRLVKTDELPKDYFKRKGFITSLLQIIDAQACPLLDIRLSENELLMNMRKTHRYLIKKAKTMPIEIIKSVKTSDLEEFLALLKKISVEKGFVVHKEIVKEFEVFIKNDEALLFIAKYQNKAIGYALVDFVGDMVIYRHAASDYNYRNIPAMYLLVWETILEAKKRKKSFYNFMGIAPEEAKKSHPWSGFTLFKTGFGGENEYYYSVMDLPLNLNYWKNYIADFLTKMQKGY